MSISDMDIKEKSLLFARLAADAYGTKAAVSAEAKKHGFTKTKFYDNGGAQAYRFESKTDVVVACRGTTTPVGNNKPSPAQQTQSGITTPVGHRAPRQNQHSAQ